MKFTKCANGYTHPEREDLPEGLKCEDCNEKECMFRK